MRWNRHLHSLRKGNHHSDHLQKSWNKYGEKNFDIEILQLVKHKKDLLTCEDFWIKKTRCAERKFGYNILPNAQNSLGYKHSNQTKRKISNWLKFNEIKYTIDYQNYVKEY